jgi:hypothetical protein
MFRPDGTQLFVRRELTTIGLPGFRQTTIPHRRSIEIRADLFRPIAEARGQGHPAFPQEDRARPLVMVQ